MQCELGSSDAFLRRASAQRHLGRRHRVHGGGGGGGAPQEAPHRRTGHVTAFGTEAGGLWHQRRGHGLHGQPDVAFVEAYGAGIGSMDDVRGSRAAPSPVVYWPPISMTASPVVLAAKVAACYAHAAFYYNCRTVFVIPVWRVRAR